MFSYIWGYVAYSYKYVQIFPLTVKINLLIKFNPILKFKAKNDYNIDPNPTENYPWVFLFTYCLKSMQNQIGYVSLANPSTTLSAWLKLRPIDK